MLCHVCQQKKATIHVSEVLEGHVNEGHFCKVCVPKEPLVDLAIARMRPDPRRDSKRQALMQEILKLCEEIRREFEGKQLPGSEGTG